MRFLTAGAVLAATFTGVVADLCEHGSTDDGGNWYCQEVKAVTYTGLSGSGSYNKVTSMDSTSSTCSSSPFGYSGSMSPLDEEVSLHFRGPLALKQFAVYTPGSSSSKAKKAKRSGMKRHGHEHLEKHKRHAHEAAQQAENDKRALGDVVIATIDGQVVSWLNNWSGEATTAAEAAAPATTLATSAAPAATTAAAETSAVEASSSSAVNTFNRVAAQKASSTPSSSGAAATQTSTSGSWSRQAYYNAASGHADGVVFLNHNGGQGSGVFDYTFGNSLSYASEDATSGSSSPQVLADTTLPSNTEVVIMSDSECNNGDCGYTRDGTVAYHGWGGSQKAFLFEFQMPQDSSNDASFNGNMPAIWMLNAQIPRTLQYGQADCSCWTTGCGEFDIFEVLAPGDERCKSTLHGNINGGDSDYFKRPTDSTIKAAMIMNGDNIHIKVLDDSYEFGSSLDEAAISDICSSTLIESLLVSIFNLVS
ncbi:hypothetical protein AAFC00_007016 [Neodothiora populina]|uniref:glucan endo-1,3-beta-D-glucosidase n=1 Tax=Neodothiora populina TaxID=2781224 RepID=A0ABR3PC14_9PEZI